ncbi:MAG: PDZ domain-containing protein [Patescibacteria group bacterium]
MTNMTAAKKSFLTWALALVLSAGCGGLAGGLAGYAAARSSLAASPSFNASGTQNIPETKSPTSTLALITVERPALTSVVPAAFLKHRARQSAALYRAPRSENFDDRLLGDERLLGQAVALTSDGWFITTEAALGGLKRADFVVWYGAASYVAEKGFVDHLNGTVYFKIALRDVPAASFAQVRDLLPGIEVWSEQRPGELAPQVITDLNYRADPNVFLSSENVARRIVLSGTAQAASRGSAAWDASGQLIGIVESAPGEVLRLIPVSSIAASFTSLLQQNEIRHAVLGVRALDLAVMRLAGTRGDLPARGAYLRDDKKITALLRDGPAAKAKLKSGDVILSVERDILDGSADLGEILSEYKPGSRVTLRVQRDGKDTDIPVTLGSFVSSEALK